MSARGADGGVSARGAELPGPDEAWLAEARERAERRFRALGPPGRSTTWWGLATAMVSLATILGALVYAYAYLWVSADRWPPVGAGPPALGWSSVGLGALAAACLLAVPAFERALGWVPPSVGVVVLGAVFTAAQTVDVVRSAHLVDVDGFWAITVTLQAAGGLLGVVGVLIGAVSVWLRRRVGWVEATRLTALWWWFVGASWPVLWATAYVAPRVA